MPIYSTNVPEHLLDHPAKYHIALLADDAGLYVVVDSDNYRLGETRDPELIRDMVESENDAFEASKQAKTYRQLKGMFS